MYTSQAEAFMHGKSLRTHVTHEALAGAGEHGQREKVEVEGVGLVLVVLPHEAGQPKLSDEKALRPIPILQHPDANMSHERQYWSLDCTRRRRRLNEPSQQQIFIRNHVTQSGL